MADHGWPGLDDDEADGATDAEVREAIKEAEDD